MGTVQPDISQTTNTFAQQMILQSSIVQRDQRNADLIVIFHSKWVDYASNMTSGGFVPPERRNPPAPPMGWELAPPDANGYVWIRIGSTPVCAQPLTPGYNGGMVPPPSSPNAPPPPPGTEPVFDLGHPDGNNTGWYSAGPDDTEPSGFKKTLPIGPGGTMITVMKIRVPFGGLYEQVG